MTFVRKMVKNCIIGKKTASIKIPPSRSAESTSIILKTPLWIKPPVIEVKMRSLQIIVYKNHFFQTFLAFELHRLSYKILYTKNNIYNL